MIIILHEQGTIWKILSQSFFASVERRRKPQSFLHASNFKTGPEAETNAEISAETNEATGRKEGERMRNMQW